MGDGEKQADDQFYRGVISVRDECSVALIDEPDGVGRGEDLEGFAGRLDSRPRDGAVGEFGREPAEDFFRGPADDDGQGDPAEGNGDKIGVLDDDVFKAAGGVGGGGGLSKEHGEGDWWVWMCKGNGSTFQASLTPQSA